MQHIIKKQIINFSVGKKMDAFPIQQKVSSHFWNKIVPVLERAFDAASTEEETITLDTLEIDLGIINEREIEKGGWEEQVFKKITEQLLPVKHKLPSQLAIKRELKTLSVSGQWIFYMQHGYLPWNVLKIDQDWYDKVLEAFAADASAIVKLRNLINRQPNSVKRIVFQNSESFLQALIETLTAENQDALQKYIHEIALIILSKDRKRKSIDLSQGKEVKQKLWEQVLQLAASIERNLKSLNIALQLIEKNFTARELSSKKIKDFLEKNNIDVSSLKEIKKHKEDKELNNVKEKNVPLEDIKKEIKNEINEDGIFLLNAGIVLLHPFLTLFFRNLQLLQEDNFKDIFSQQKALYLLHYLATGSTGPEEHELVMPKVLCAFSMEEPVSTLIELSPDELQEADSLLVSAIEQWEILKGTSPGGLREGFLQRNGKLINKNGQLQLQVEASSIDVLLDQLPWNLSIVKLPWMENLLKVEWR